MAPTALDKVIVDRENIKSKLHYYELQIAAHATMPVRPNVAAHNLEKVSNYENLMFEVQAKIIALAPPDMNPHDTELIAIMDRISSLIDQYTDIVKPTITTSGSTSTSQQHLRLPTIKIPTFTGNITDWTQFHDLFTTMVHNNTSLSDAQKFAHLKGFLADEPARLIKTLAMTDANYQIAWNQLLRRYQHERELLFATFKKFMAQPVAQESPESLRALLDTANECLESLKVQTYDPEKCMKAFMLFIILGKLDPTTKLLWDQSLQDSKTPELQVLLNFVEQRAVNLTSASSAKTLKTQHRHDTPKKHATAHHVGEVMRCKVCSQSHPLYKCTKFTSKSPAERNELVKKHSLCFNCLQSGHGVGSCSSPRRCKVCNKKHNSLLHKESVSQPANLEVPDASTALTFHSNEDNGSHESILATALVRVLDGHGNFQPCRVFLDAGSTRSFITTSCANRLKLETKKSDVEVVGLSSTPVGTARGSTTVVFKPHFETPSKFTIEALVMTKITGRLPLDPCDASNWSHLKGLRYADPQFSKPAPIDILLGSDIFWNLILDGKQYGPPNSPVAINSVLGWLIGGRTGSQPRKVHVHYAETSLDEAVKRFWEIESLPESSSLTVEEQAAERHFEENTIRLSTGRFCVKLPWKDTHTSLGESRATALRRFRQLEIRLPKTPHYHAEYRKFMEEYESLGHMEKVPQAEVLNPLYPTYYIPHHYVLKADSTTTKFRTVFDASSKTTSGSSLNEVLMVGPILQDNLVDQIMRFRFHPIAFTADIGKMYRQIRVDKQDCDRQRILWREDPTKPIDEYRLLTVSYGTASAPYLATKVLQTLAKEAATDLPLASEVALRDFYMDDVMSGADTVKEAISIKNELLELMERGCFDLRKFTSNSQDFLQSLPEELREKTSSRVPLTTTSPPIEERRKSLRHSSTTTSQLGKEGTRKDFESYKKREDSASYHEDSTQAQLNQDSSRQCEDSIPQQYEDSIPQQCEDSIPKQCEDSTRRQCEDSTSSQCEDSLIDVSTLFQQDFSVKCLGIHWNTTKDVWQFVVKLPLSSSILTKRIVLSETAQLFDPMGWLGPVVIRAKIHIQQLWKKNLGWDKELSVEDAQFWMDFKKSLIQISNLHIPRCVRETVSVRLELAGFCDASERAYAAAVYVCSYFSDRPPTSHLLISKTRVAPARQISLPRLELCGAVLLSQLIVHARISIRRQIHVSRAWTDSTVVLAWINSLSCNLKTFVANRVSEIQNNLSPEFWYHVPGVDNPADCASRGISPEELIHHPLWWNGPSFLLDSQLQNSSVILNEEDESARNLETKVVVSSASCQSSDSICSSMLKKFSSLRKIVNVLAWTRRFVLRKFYPRTDCYGPLSAEELRQAMRILLFEAQQSTFADELKFLREGKQLPLKSRILGLSPYLDEEGLLRVGGRLKHASLPFRQRHPILLPRHHRLTDLIINQKHMQFFHAGPQLLLSMLQQEYWIVRGRDAVRFAVQKCMVCRKQAAKTMSSKMGNLPVARVNQGRPFLNCGVDYAGPLILKSDAPRSKVKVKAYLCIFVCFATKAVHLELASSLSTDAFLAALRRFVSRRNKPTTMYSDCGTNFVGAAREIKKTIALIASSEFNQKLSKSMAEDGIEWRFNPPGAPHFGGLWEAGVKSVKHHLYRVIGSVSLKFEEMTTLLCEIEACLNSRPLTPLSASPDDLEALTPSHFLTGAPSGCVPQADLLDLNTGRLDRWQLMQQKTQEFWKRWSNEYITRLQQRPKWMVQRQEIKIHDLVIIKHDHLPPQKWRLGRVIQVHPGSDGIVRVVTLKTADGEMQRPIVKLCLLPFDQKHELSDCEDSISQREDSTIRSLD